MKASEITRFSQPIFVRQCIPTAIIYDFNLLIYLIAFSHTAGSLMVKFHDDRTHSNGSVFDVMATSTMLDFWKSTFEDRHSSFTDEGSFNKDRWNHAQFQNGGRRRLGFWKFENFIRFSNGASCSAPTDKISRRSVINSCLLTICKFSKWRLPPSCFSEKNFYHTRIYNWPYWICRSNVMINTQYLCATYSRR